MSKICFVSVSNLFLVPYLSNYTKSLTSENYDVIVWNRLSLKEESKSNVITFNAKLGSYNLTKVISYIRYARFVRKTLKSKKYDKVVFLHNIVPVLLYRFIVKNFKNRYIYDIRDYSFEHYKTFVSRQQKLINSSALTVISSEGYKFFLPQSEYIVSHNYSLEHIKRESISKNNSQKINISFIGYIRFYNIAKVFIDEFKNDDRFELNFIGTGANELRDLVNDKSINNIKFIDYFDPKDTMYYYERCDIIYNLYGYGTPLLDFALSNKLYYAAHLYKPILVFQNTYMETISSKYKFGIPVPHDLRESADYVFNVYNMINENDFKDGCDTFIEKVKNDNFDFNSRVADFYKSGFSI